MGLRPTLLCVQRVAPASALAAEASAADWMQSVCPQGVYATLLTTKGRSMVHKLSARCARLATAHELLLSEGRAVVLPEAAERLGATFAASLRSALANDSSVRFLAANELHITVHASTVEGALNVYVQPAPRCPLPADSLDAALSPPLEHAAESVRDDLHRGVLGGWATPLIHPTLDVTWDPELEETLLHEATTDLVVEGVNSNLFVMMADGSLRTAGIGEGAYPGSVREAVLDLARRQPSARRLFPGGVHERAATAAQLAAGEWLEAWLTCSSRRVAPLARIWRRGSTPGAGSWAELRSRERGWVMRELLDELILRESEPL